MIFLGSTESGDPYVFLSRREAGLDNLEKLRAASGIRIGAQTVGHSVYNSGRIFAYLMGLKDPRFVVGFGGPELDVALVRGEIDARANSADTVAGRNREALEKGAFHIHATITIPRGKFHPRFANVPELDTFTKNEKRAAIGATVSFVSLSALALCPASRHSAGNRKDFAGSHGEGI